MLTIGTGPKWATSVLITAFLGFLPRFSAAQAPGNGQAAPSGLEPGADTATGVRGRVLDRRSGRPLQNAPVIVQGGGKLRNTVTDANGIYRFYLPPGPYTVRSYYDLYHGAKIAGAVVVRGTLLEVSLQLARIDEDRDVSVEELEIPYRADTTTAAAQDQLRQASSGIGEGLGAKQMSQAGASDAGSAAARVVGVTIESSQLVIRGLGGRYTRVLLNGIPVPSVDPDIPGADLDMFPTGVIDSLNISKTFLPDIPADFAGGVMEIKSVSFPRKFTLELDLSHRLRFAVDLPPAPGLPRRQPRQPGLRRRQTRAARGCSQRSPVQRRDARICALRPGAVLSQQLAVPPQELDAEAGR